MNKQFSALARTRMAALTASLFRSSRQNKKRSLLAKIGIGFLIFYVLGAFLMMSVTMLMQLAKPLYDAGIPWLYFSLSAIISLGIMFVGSVFTAQAQLYEAKDNELLLSMPIKPSMILGSRLVMLLSLNLLFEAFIAIPAGVIWLLTNPSTPFGIIAFVLIFAALPFFSLALSCAVGALIAAISSRIKNKSLVITVLSLAALLGYFAVVGRINVYITKLVTNGEAIAESLSAVAPIYWIGEAIAYTRPVPLLISMAIMVVPAIAVYIILSKTFIGIATRKRGFAKTEYHGGEMKTASVKSALLRRELSHLASSPMYMMNACLGVVFTIAAAVIVAVKRDIMVTIANEFPALSAYIPAAMTAALCMLATMCIITAPSVSLEGKTLWIVRSIPVSSADILMAKVKMHLLITIPPSIIASLILCFIVSPNAVQALSLIILPALVNIFCAFFGLIVNLRFPRFDWISETAAVKQSAATMIAMFGSFAVVGIFALIGILLIPYLPLDVYILICGAVFALLSWLSYNYVKGAGARKFESLS